MQCALISKTLMDLCTRDESITNAIDWMLPDGGEILVCRCVFFVCMYSAEFGVLKDCFVYGVLCYA